MIIKEPLTLEMEMEYEALDLSSSVTHYGVKYRSGRYPYGSGENPYQHEAFAWRAKYDKLRYEHPEMSEYDRARQLGFSSTKELREKVTWAKEIIADANKSQVRTMNEDGKSVQDIAKRTGLSASTVRKYIAKDPEGLTVIERNKETQVQNTVKVLKDQIKKDGYLDVGEGVEVNMGVKRNTLDAALRQLKDEGYYVHNIHNQRMGDKDKYTTIKTLSQNPDPKDVWKNHLYDIKAIGVHSDTGGIDFKYQGIKPPEQLDGKRIAIRYGEQGGKELDGTIEIRPGAKGLDLGDAHYAQVRIAVDGKYYLKGMAYYSDNVPKGKDIVFNTNKLSKDSDGNHVGPDKVFKHLNTDNPDNPFGAYIKPQGQRGYINVVNEEGDWQKWQHNMASQFLSKQPIQLIKERLSVTSKEVESDLDSIKQINNPVVKKMLLKEYADSCERKSVELKARGTANSCAQVILPSTKIKPTEIYAPNFKNGDRVIAVRYPHGGIFELAALTVNNKVAAAKEMIGSHPVDAVVIHPTVAQKLSGADYDGDNVYLFKNNNNAIKSRDALPGLKDFDPNIYYAGKPTISHERMQQQMGVVSNLITDMTLKGASDDELVRAVRHSMVVIDSEKHELDYKQSERDNAINALKQKYQDGGGASTIISQAKAPEYVTVKNYRGEDKLSKITGEPVKKRVPRMTTVDDAFELVSKDKNHPGYQKEVEYAKYANKMKALKNESMKLAEEIEYPAWNRALGSKGGKYYAEVQSINKKYNLALQNKPKERQAQLIASKQYNLKKDQYSTDDDRNRLRVQLENGARGITGSQAGKVLISFTDKEWEAIQANAISSSRLESMLKYCDKTRLRQLATPKKEYVVSSAKESRIKSMLASGYTQAEIADRLGISASTVSRVASGKK